MHLSFGRVLTVLKIGQVALNGAEISDKVVVLYLELTVLVLKLFESSSANGLFCFRWHIAISQLLVDCKGIFLATVIALILFPIFQDFFQPINTLLAEPPLHAHEQVSEIIKS